MSVNNSTLTANQAGATYQWLDCTNGNTTISGETNQSFTPTAGGDYAVIVTFNGCTATSDCIGSSVGLYELIRNTIKLYPNPTNGIYTIDLGEDHSLVEVEITTSIGQIISNEAFVDIKQIDGNLSGPTGVYLVKITLDNIQFINLLIKQ